MPDAESGVCVPRLSCTLGPGGDPLPGPGVLETAGPADMLCRIGARAIPPVVPAGPPAVRPATGSAGATGVHHLPTRILLVDDHRMVREALRGLIDTAAELTVVGEAGDGREALEHARRLRPDVVVIDVDMPELNGVEATRQLKQQLPRIRVLALSMHGAGRYVTRMLEAGATGYMLKDCAFDELAAAIATVADGRVYLGPAITDVVVRDYVQRLASEPGGAHAALSPREREVLQLLAEGQSTRDVATRLYVSVKTIETHRKNMMDRLGIHSLAELTKYAIREGLTSK